jgi:hypothetical protein
LTNAAREWQEHGGDESYLYAGSRLAVAREWCEAHAPDLNPLEEGMAGVFPRSALSEDLRLASGFEMTTAASYSSSKASTSRYVAMLTSDPFSSLFITWTVFGPVGGGGCSGMRIGFST